jgi:hypothetical protein
MQQSILEHLSKVVSSDWIQRLQAHCALFPHASVKKMMQSIGDISLDGITGEIQLLERSNLRTDVQSNILLARRYLDPQRVHYQSWYQLCQYLINTACFIEKHKLIPSEKQDVSTLIHAKNVIYSVNIKSNPISEAINHLQPTKYTRLFYGTTIRVANDILSGKTIITDEDFSNGFYMTNSWQVAYQIATDKAIIEGSQGIILVYDLDIEGQVKEICEDEWVDSVYQRYINHKNMYNDFTIVKGKICINKDNVQEHWKPISCNEEQWVFKDTNAFTSRIKTIQTISFDLPL